MFDLIKQIKVNILYVVFQSKRSWSNSSFNICVLFTIFYVFTCAVG